MKKNLEKNKTRTDGKMEDVIYAFVRPDDETDETSCLRSVLEYFAELNNCHVIFGDISSGIFSPPLCLVCIVDRLLLGKDEWDNYLKSTAVLAGEKETVYIIIDEEEYSLPKEGTYVIIPVKHDDEGYHIGNGINYAIEKIKFLAYCKAGRDNELMPAELDSVFTATDDKNLRETLIRWSEKNGCRLIWGEDKDFEAGVGKYPMCCVFDKMSINDEARIRYRDILSPNMNMIDEFDGNVIYSCVKIEDDYFVSPLDWDEVNPLTFNKGVQIRMDREEVRARIIHCLDEAKKYRDEIIWPRMKSGNMESSLELLGLSPNVYNGFGNGIDGMS